MIENEKINSKNKYSLYNLQENDDLYYQYFAKNTH